jgi:hypothetical protein
MTLSDDDRPHRGGRRILTFAALGFCLYAAACATWMRGGRPHEGGRRGIVLTDASKSVLLSGEISTHQLEQAERILKEDLMPALRSEPELAEVRAFVSNDKTRLGILVTFRSSTTDAKSVLSRIVERLSKVGKIASLARSLRSTRVEILEQRDDLSMMAATTFGTATTLGVVR